jgi:hypothetical protein
MKEYIRIERYNYADENNPNHVTTTKLDTLYDQSDESDELKISLTHDTNGQSVTNYIYLGVGDVDELIYSLVLFKQDVKSAKFDRESEKL